jgi:uncharacterized membrane protein YdbT with pleckstrin-like domain
MCPVIGVTLSMHQFMIFAFMKWLIFAVIVVLLSWLSASYHRRNGYFFWRTFIMAILGFTGLLLLVWKLFFM